MSLWKGGGGGGGGGAIVIWIFKQWLKGGGDKYFYFLTLAEFIMQYFCYHVCLSMLNLEKPMGVGVWLLFVLL